MSLRPPTEGTPATATFESRIATIESATGIVPVGTLGNGTAEPATPFQNAYVTATALGRDVYIPAGTYYISDASAAAVFQLARDNARTGPKVRIVFDPGATIKLSALTPRLVDFAKQADFDWFRNVEFVGNGATIDANSVAGSHHLLIGTLRGGVNQQYLNYEHIAFRNFKVVNLYTDNTDAGVSTANIRHAVWLAPLGHPSTNTYGNYLEFEDIDIAGGNGGITVGNSGAGSKFNWDRVYIRRCRHDRGLITENYGGANSFYIGSRGVGGQGGFEDCYSRGAGDAAYEINGPAEGYVKNCEAVDPSTTGFLHRGANGGTDPADPGSFTIYDDCFTRKVERTGTMRHVKLGVDTAGDYDYGTVEIRGGGCAFERTDNAELSVLVAASPANYRAVIVNRHELVIKAGASSANPGVSTLVTSPVYLDRGNGGLFMIRGLNIKLEGVVAVGVGLSRRGLDVRGTWRLDWDGVNIDDSQTFTGGTPNLRGIGTGLALNASGSKSAVWGRIRNARVTCTVAGSTGMEHGAFATQTQAVAGRIVDVDGLDCSEMAASPVPVSSSGANLKEIRARNVIPRGTFAFPSVASAATINLPAYDVTGEVITVTGTTGVTAITASYAGRIVRLSVTGACTFTDNGTTLNLVGNFTGPGYLVLLCDGTNWIEIGRSLP